MRSAFFTGYEDEEIGEVVEKAIEMCFDSVGIEFDVGRRTFFKTAHVIN